jgi:hypothetical protein
MNHRITDIICKAMMRRAVQERESDRAAAKTGVQMRAQNPAATVTANPIAESAYYRSL